MGHRVGRLAQNTSPADKERPPVARLRIAIRTICLCIDRLSIVLSRTQLFPKAGQVLSSLQAISTVVCRDVFRDRTSFCGQGGMLFESVCCDRLSFRRKLATAANSTFGNCWIRLLPHGYRRFQMQPARADVVVGRAGVPGVVASQFMTNPFSAARNQQILAISDQWSRHS